MIQGKQADPNQFNSLQLETEARKKRYLQQLLRSGTGFNTRAAWQCFEKYNDAGLIERYREEYATILRLMVEWTFPEQVLRLMLNGVSLESALYKAQSQLDEQACRRVQNLTTRPQSKPTAD